MIWEKQCVTRYDPNSDRGTLYCWYEKKKTNCRKVERLITYVYEIETEEARKDRIAKYVNEEIKKAAKNAKETCDKQKSNSQSTQNQQDDYIPDIDCELIYEHYEALTHDLESIGNKEIEDGPYGFPKVLGRTTMHKSAGDRRYTKIWIDVEDHEVYDRRDEQISNTMIHERIHSQDYLEDGVYEEHDHTNPQDDDVVQDSNRLDDLIVIPSPMWEAHRNLIATVDGWLSLQDLFGGN